MKVLLWEGDLDVGLPEFGIDGRVEFVDRGQPVVQIRQEAPQREVQRAVREPIKRRQRLGIRK